MERVLRAIMFSHCLSGIHFLERFTSLAFRLMGRVAIVCLLGKIGFSPSERVKMSLLEVPARTGFEF
jgi:hypothetical protein